MTRLLALFAGCVMVPLVASAGPIGLRTTASTSGACFDVGTSEASCSAHIVSVDNSDPTFPMSQESDQTANATASFGTLHAYVNEVQVEPRFGLVGFDVAASTAFTDDLTVRGGDAGDGFIQYRFNGSLEGGGTESPGGFLSGFYFQHDGSAPQGLSVFDGLCATNLCGGDGTFTYASPLMPFEFGTPFELYVFAQARVVGAAGDGMGGMATVMDLTLDGFRVFDAEQELVRARIFSAANGPPPQASQIPEPTTFLLVGAGVLAARATDGKQACRWVQSQVVGRQARRDDAPHRDLPPSLGD